MLTPFAAVHRNAERGGCEVTTAIGRAKRRLAETQGADGAWHHDYSGPSFVLPGFVVAWYVVGELPEEDRREKMRAFLRNSRNDDGGWGLFPGGATTLYSTVLCHVALRLLGTPASDPVCRRSREWIHEHGGAVAVPLWGKFLLCVLNLYDYRGVPPVSPELWLLPERLPFHPRRWWCHNRMVMLPLSYLYGIRAQAPLDDLLRSLREELFVEPYERIDWRRSRTTIAESDRLVPESRLFGWGARLLSVYERFAPESIRRRACDLALEQIEYEDRQTSFVCLGPVNKGLNLLCRHFSGDRDAVESHLAKLSDYLWETDSEIRGKAYNSSAFWDTAFTIQAATAAGSREGDDDGDDSPLERMLARAARFVSETQVRADPPQAERFHRHPARGGWPFSTLEHGWPISDCTAEGIKASLCLEDAGMPAVSRERLDEAIEWILGMQNRDGGWATYEPTRGPRWLEKLNATSLFADVMIDYSYVECTSACVQALAAISRRDRTARQSPRIREAIDRGVRFLLATQRGDGSWIGAWGVCFTYGTWFGVWGLLEAGLPEDHPAVRRACAFLLSRQRPDGSWSESLASCWKRRSVPLSRGHVVMTAWSLLALIRAGMGESVPVRAGIRYLLREQRRDGTWPSAGINGVFNQTCGVQYDSYSTVFPLWALALHRARRDSAGPSDD